MKNFSRAYKLTIDRFNVSGLDIVFEIEKSVKREPNKATIKVFNMPVEIRRYLSALSTKKKKGPGKIRVELEAGYVENKSLIFRGDLRTAISEQDGPDVVTTLEGEDGGRSMLWARINQTFPAGTRVDSVITACAQALGVGIGNTMEVVRLARLEGGGGIFTAGTTLSGSAHHELDGLLKSIGMTWSIQNGAIQILKRGRAVQTTSIKLTPDSGLVGSPQRQPDGTISFKALLNPEIYPGRQISFEEEGLSGTYKVKKLKYQGDSVGLDWYVDGEVTELQHA